MLIKFMTARNTCGHRYYIAIDTEAKTFTRNCPYMIPDGVEVKKRDYNKIVETVKNANYTEV